MRAVRHGTVSAQARAVEQIGGNVRRVPDQVGRAGRYRQILLVIEMDVVIGNVGEIVRAELELA
jgi:hypothetical protein